MRGPNRVTEARKRLEARLRLRMRTWMPNALKVRRNRGYCDGMLNSPLAAQLLGWQHVLSEPRAPFTSNS